MGEAKFRRNSDPTYGRRKRGLILSAPIEIEGSKLNIKTSSLELQELRFALLFWDELIWPSSRAINCASGPDELFLEQEGILTRPEFTVWGDAAQGMAASYIQAFDEYEARQPGKWSLAQGENSLLVKDGLLVPEAGAFLQLHRAIPVPDRDVPLQDILEFRSRRLPELLALQERIDTFVAKVDAASNREAELSLRVQAVDNGCADILKVSLESRLPIRLSSLKVSLDLRPFASVAAGYVGWKAAEPQGLVLAATSALITGAGASLKIGGDFGINKNRSTVRRHPFRYVSQYHNEVFR